MTSPPPPLCYPRRTLRLVPLRRQTTGITCGGRRFDRWSDLAAVRGKLEGIFADVNDDTPVLQVKIAGRPILWAASPLAHFKLSGGLLNASHYPGRHLDVQVLPGMRLELDIAGVPTTVVLAVREPLER